MGTNGSSMNSVMLNELDSLSAQKPTTDCVQNFNPVCKVCRIPTCDTGVVHSNLDKEATIMSAQAVMIRAMLVREARIAGLRCKVNKDLR